eukprot:scaffold10127_cov64-Phaeocystis_antarctica.AAC.3
MELRVGQRLQSGLAKALRLAQGVVVMVGCMTSALVEAMRGLHLVGVVVPVWVGSLFGSKVARKEQKLSLQKESARTKSHYISI